MDEAQIYYFIGQKQSAHQLSLAGLQLLQEQQQQQLEIYRCPALFFPICFEAVVKSNRAIDRSFVRFFPASWPARQRVNQILTILPTFCISLKVRYNRLCVIVCFLCPSIKTVPLYRAAAAIAGGSCYLSYSGARLNGDPTM